jgi:DNA polymerase III alpha subunit
MKFAVEIVRLKQIKTKRGKDPGQDMAFLTIEDNSCSLDNAVCFPNIWKECKDAIYEGNVVLIHGERDKDSLVVQRVWQI